MGETKRPRGRPPRPGGAREAHTHRFDPATYARAELICAHRGETVGDVLARALENFVRRHGSEVE